jgi:hypothetical protein
MVLMGVEKESYFMHMKAYEINDLKKIGKI